MSESRAKRWQAIQVLLVCLAMLLSVASASAVETARPDEIPGLEAWYTVHSLHEKLQDGDRVTTWPDSSGNGHDLTDDENGIPAVFQTLQLGGKPAVALRKSNSHSVVEPFELDDHTIFVVASAGFSNRALLRSDADNKQGIMLRHGNTRHVYQNGGTSRSQLIGYTRSAPLGGDFELTVLARGRNLLDAFINGVDVSSGESLSSPVRVGKFFTLEHSQFAGTDADGLRVAEIAIYDRFLEDDERDAVTRHLSREYDIPIDIDRQRTENTARWPEETIRARLGSESPVDLNTEATSIPWDVSTKLDAPLRHDAKENPWRIYSTTDGTRIRLVASLPMSTKLEGARLRLLLLKNDVEYLPDETKVGPFTGTTTARIGAVVTLDAGESLEVSTCRDEGAPSGPVLLSPEGAQLLIRID